MTIQRVYVIWIHSLFRDAARMLLAHPDIELVGAASDYTTALGEIHSLSPDTILVEKPSVESSSEILEILEKSPGNIRVISMNMIDNRLSIFNHEHREADHSDDLLQSILRISK